MYKKVSFVSNVLLFTNSVLILFCFRHISDFYFVKLMLCIFVMLVLLILTYVEVRQKNRILRDKKYIMMSLFVNGITFVIYLRDQFDFYIPLNSIYSIDSFGFESTGSMFLDYNLLFILIMYSGLLFYNILNKEKKKKKKIEAPDVLKK